MDFEQAKLNPSSVFDSPAAVATTQTLTTAEKIEVLRQWEYDARELQVAAEENMGEGPGELLDEVLAALNRLGAGVSTDQAAPTKQGGV
ncbi:hypothetical protein [Leptolyngbya iicbica]|uniref:Uncharacterized protein n=2 Tax=Cyanophyceae TaxID=3028117 RepID=A0A4V2E284_9CYAN|nr:hypothetical protein [Leptolyngbya sp. LK]RZM77362.1 hypothetical protein DYY88_17145 [Leptolyngbya sp. LK]